MTNGSEPLQSRAVNMKPDTDAAAGCPHCDTTLAPELVAPGVWLCPCCASLFRASEPEVHS